MASRDISLLTSVVVSKVQQCLGVLEALGGVLSVPGQGEEHGAGGQGGGGLPRQVRAGAALSQAEGGPAETSGVWTTQKIK